MRLLNSILSSIAILASMKVLYLHAFKLPVQPRMPLIRKSLAFFSTLKDYKEHYVKAIEAKGEEVSVPVKNMLIGFIDEYTESSEKAGLIPEAYQHIIGSFIKHTESALKQPHQFSPFHKAIREPFDFYKWGNEFMKTLVVLEQSQLLGLENFQQMEQLLQKGDNVCILSNHQTEADPQVISILLEQHNMGHIAERMIFIAGHKVTNDPVAIPFSMGRNLICIHSKKHIKNPPEEYAKKSQQNLDTMAALGELMKEGGNIFWVAPSGGRDRPNEANKFVVAPFDMKALDMFKLIAMQSGHACHFFPMAMYTHQLIPPPKTVSSDLGESRSAQRGAVSVSLLPPTNGLGGLKDKVFTAEVQQAVDNAYEALYQYHNPTSTSSS